MHPLEAFCCQHFPCSDYGQRGVGNLRWYGWSSKKNQIRMLSCRTCKTILLIRCSHVSRCFAPPTETGQLG